MRYVDSVLQPGEVVRHVSSLHWTLYAPGAVLWIAAGIIALAGPDASVRWLGHGLAVIAAWLCFAAGLVLLARAWFKWWTTEIAVTDRRVVSKTGFIWRNTTEMHMDKVESVEVKQSPWPHSRLRRRGNPRCRRRTRTLAHDRPPAGTPKSYHCHLGARTAAATSASALRQVARDMAPRKGM